MLSPRGTDSTRSRSRHNSRRRRLVEPDFDRCQPLVGSCTSGAVRRRVVFVSWARGHVLLFWIAVTGGTAVDAPNAYAKALFAQQRRLPAWPPTRLLQVGQVLAVSDGQINVVSSLRMLTGMDLPVLVEEMAGEVHDSRGASFDAAVEGATGPAAAALRFAEGSSFVFKARVTELQRFEDLTRVAEVFRKAAADGQWDGRHQLVTEVQHASAMTLLLSGGRGTVVRAAVDVPVGALPGAGDVRAGAAVSVSSGECAQYVVPGACTPSYQGYAFSRSMLDWRRALRPLRAFGGAGEGVSRRAGGQDGDGWGVVRPFTLR